MPLPLQDTPGLYSAVSTADHLRCLLTFLLGQLEKDYELLHT